MGTTVIPIHANETANSVRNSEEHRWKVMYEGEGGRIVDKSRRGNRTWWVIDSPRNAENGLSNPFLAVTIFDGRGGKELSRRDVSEGEGPSQLDCPIGFLEKAPVANQAWRDRVHAYHVNTKARRKSAMRVKEQLAVGRSIQLNENLSFEGQSQLIVYEITTRGLLAQASSGRLVSVRFSQISHVLDTSATGTDAV